MPDYYYFFFCGKHHVKCSKTHLITDKSSLIWIKQSVVTNKEGQRYYGHMLKQYSNYNSLMGDKY